MTTTLCRSLTCTLLLVLSATALAEQQRPVIGLVLSGGGARGAAHVGVIRVLEELRVPIDVIAGTSMGAVVGGLYAAGKNAAELTAIVEEMDWDGNFLDDPDRAQLSYRRKQDDRDFLIDFDIGISPHGVQLPRGLVQGQNLNLLLKSQTLSVAHINDFDQLAARFRAVATDIETGTPYVLAKGNLATAMRASMAVPGVIAPVDYQGRLLVDGGVSNNLPINVARDLGADILIVVDIQFPLVTRDELQSAVDITNQLLTILVLRESRSQLNMLHDNDIVIVPNLGTMGSTEFELAPAAIVVGETSAREHIDALSSLSLSKADYAAFLASRKPIAKELAIDYVRVKGSSALTDEVLEARLNIDNGPLNLDQLESGIAELYGLNTFELVDYEIETDGTHTGLAVTATDKSWGPDYINLGARLIDDLNGRSRYTLGLRYTRTAVNDLGAEWRNDLQIGTNPRLYSEFYQPLDATWRYFIAPQLEFQRFEADVFEGEARIAEFVVSSARAGFDFGRTLGNWGEVRIGLQRTTGRTSLRTGAIDQEPVNFNSGGFVAGFGRDTLDSVDFPRDGWQAEVQWNGFREALGSRNATDRIEGSSIWAHSYGRKTWVLAQRAGTNLRSEGAIQSLFELGGLFNLSGLSNGQLRGQHYAIVDVVHYRRLNASSNFDTPIYAGASLELGNVWNRTSEIKPSNSIFAGSIFLGIDTFVGPIYLAYGLAEGGQAAAYFLLGQGFE